MAKESNLSDKAWQAWRDGNVDEAKSLAAQILSSGGASGEARHLLRLTSFVMVDYEGVIVHCQDIEPSYSRYQELDDPVLNAYLHLGRYADAECFARDRGIAPWRCEVLARWRENPLKAHLSNLTVVPFAEHPLSEFFPGFEVELDGQKVVAHMDTGGTFLFMSPTRAKELGIEVMPGGEGQFHGNREGVPMSHGIVGSFRLGEAVLENVPVIAIPTLVEQQDFIIFGTNVLQQFLSTLDYPSQRLILSPPGDSNQRLNHLAMLPRDHVEIPFYMWGDHYMFARGGVGAHQQLNFFIDSGLVSFHPDASGRRRQAAFVAPRDAFSEWGVDPAEVEKGVFELPLPLSLGPLQQTGLIVIAKDGKWGHFGGVRIDGLLSHAFLKRYVWTLDFPNIRYIFSTGQQ